MKSIGVDFKNNMICIMTDTQKGTEHAMDVLSDRSKFDSFIPEKYRNHTSYTWNFENETFSVNQEYNRIPGAIITEDCFIPEIILPMSGLKKRWKEMQKLLGMEEIDLRDEIKKTMPWLSDLL